MGKSHSLRPIADGIAKPGGAGNWGNFPMLPIGYKGRSRSSTALASA